MIITEISYHGKHSSFIANTGNYLHDEYLIIIFLMSRFTTAVLDYIKLTIFVVIINYLQ